LSQQAKLGYLGQLRHVELAAIVRYYRQDEVGAEVERQRDEAERLMGLAMSDDPEREERLRKAAESVRQGKLGC
jgi:hypothetical protein